MGSPARQFAAVPLSHALQLVALHTCGVQLSAHMWLQQRLQLPAFCWLLDLLSWVETGVGRWTAACEQADWLPVETVGDDMYMLGCHTGRASLAVWRHAVLVLFCQLALVPSVVFVLMLRQLLR